MSGYMQQVRSTGYIVYLDARDDTLDRQLKKYPVGRGKEKRMRRAKRQASPMPFRT